MKSSKLKRWIVKDFDPMPWVPESSRKSLKIMGRAARFGLGAAGQAIADSGLNMDWENPEKIGVCMGGGVVPLDDPNAGKNPAAVALGKLGGAKGGAARAAALSPRKRKMIAKKAALARWAK